MDKRFVIVLLLIFGVFVGIMMFNDRNKTADDENVSAQGSQNYYGKLDSPVTFTEFVDFQCEACYAYYPYVKQVKEKYKDRVRFQVRNYPISSGHQFAYLAARSAEAAARQNKFWEMHDKIFEGQKIWEQSQSPEKYFDGYASEIGLNLEKYKTDRDSASVAAVINKDLKDVEALGGTGTPTFVINGRLVEKVERSTEGLSSVIDTALKQAGQ